MQAFRHSNIRKNMNGIDDSMMPGLELPRLEFSLKDFDFDEGKHHPADWANEMLLDPMNVRPEYDMTQDKCEEDDMNVELELDYGDNDKHSVEIGREEHANGIGEDDQRNDLGDDDSDNDIGPLWRCQSPPPILSIQSSVAMQSYAPKHAKQEEKAFYFRSFKNKKILPFDAVTTMPISQTEQQQADRSATLMPVSSLASDRILWRLILMKRKGEFVSDVMRDGRSKGWAQELQGLLSIDTARKSGDLKRKRGSEIADVDEQEIQRVVSKPRHHAHADDFDGDGFDDDSTICASSVMNGNYAQAARASGQESNELIIDPLDHTRASAPVPTSENAILLRHRFLAYDNPFHWDKSDMVFQEMFPETTTTKADAADMFYRVLVLATKHAAKIYQSGDSIQICAEETTVPNNPNMCLNLDSVETCRDTRRQIVN